MVASPEDLPGALRAARSEAGSAFGDSAIYLERRILQPRHIEVQLLGDHHGTILPFVERECSLQRRHQKVVEESPSLAVSVETRRQMTAAAAAVAKAAGYTNAGTIEFLLDDAGAFYFLEMNTRLQVEHPITEMVSGVDLVQWQIRIARGERLTLDPDALLTPRGHAVECRVYAEDPDSGFMPSPGRITGLRVPQGPGVSDDSGAFEGGEVPIYYDPMISKLITWGEDRPHALARMRRALAEYDVRGIRTTIPFFQWVLDDEDFVAGRFDTGFIDRKLSARQGQAAARASVHEDIAAIAARCDRSPALCRGAAAGRRTPAARARVEGDADSRRLRSAGCEADLGAADDRSSARPQTADEVSVRDRRSRPHGRSAAVPHGYRVIVDGRAHTVDTLPHRRRRLVADHSRRKRRRVAQRRRRRDVAGGQWHARRALRRLRRARAHAQRPGAPVARSRGRAAAAARSGWWRRCPARWSSAGQAGRRRAAAPGPGRRRGDEDGERAARRPRRHGARRLRPRRPVGRRGDAARRSWNSGTCSRPPTVASARSSSSSPSSSAPGSSRLSPSISVPR